jgi:hypothetical protein
MSNWVEQVNGHGVNGVKVNGVATESTGELSADCLIIGTGPAGASLACLAMAKLRPIRGRASALNPSPEDSSAHRTPVGVPGVESN